MEKRGGWKTSRMTPLPKRGFGPPLVRYVFHPPQASGALFFLYKNPRRADQKLFWRGPKIFGRARSLVRFPPPIRFAPPHITAQDFSRCSVPNFYPARRKVSLRISRLERSKTLVDSVKRRGPQKSLGNKVPWKIGC